ncbi:NADPH:quinone reductase-like Zn-dependent oxidoreductase [Cryobacterium mesophilum]|uniref:NADP-dependent oxidoreductase n=1 Tax=Terrimesophilobacter mesophilus TaxID=433647 RepID=A0A4R8VCS0_9MICO|nr:NADP-dependent oxidoreductase [Terrimesophilobacter mesophilus]MBB5633984.1 NADPH:quinone reductase-like Zn-dependent oxidoreductase [Terrimesophilobacter mesophilus]TFB80643.1 NADP-dependent oxidoreductase [Terrimesophilobacter mesophilus]
MSKAVGYSEYGGPEVLEVIEVPEPHAGDGEVRVAVRAAGLNPFDFKVRRGGYIPNHQLPSLQGAEFAGVIDEVGAGVTGWSVGDEVLGWIGRGAQAEYVVVPASQIAAKPAGLDWAVAAGIGLVANTARRSVDSLELGPDDTVLVTAAAGGVGIVTVQFAKATGATVVGTASEANHEFLRGLGVIPVAYGDIPGGTSELERLRAAVPGDYTAALDTIGGNAIRIALALGIPPERINTVADRGAIDELGVNGVGGGKKTSAELAEFARQAADGELVIPIRGTYQLSDVVAAFEDAETGHGLGKVVLLVP